eukprot:TRINITY_DN74951_c0_g1_i1.p2 TRINITY_DN74951_c0_g1~~TRINITY_DN74951_c0_g1_i1.p2  ORF type:complete len:136 (-),score=44.87 TRINITY_DN74951_c0_g1_i1:78-485(-)
MATKGALTKFFTYSRTMKSETEYANRMRRLSNQIFGESRRPETNSTIQMAKKFAAEPKEQRERWIVYYPAHEETNELMRHLRDYGLYRDEHKDFCDEMDRLRDLRGKNKARRSWVDGKRPVKIVEPRYDGLDNHN